MDVLQSIIHLSECVCEWCALCEWCVCEDILCHLLDECVSEERFFFFSKSDSWKPRKTMALAHGESECERICGLLLAD